MRCACAPLICNSANRSLLPWAALAVGLATAGHFLWEAAQLPLYTLWRTGTQGAIAFALLRRLCISEIIIAADKRPYARAAF